MNLKHLSEAARKLAIANKQHAVIIIAIGPEEISWKAWSPTGAEQKVSDKLADHAAHKVREILETPPAPNKPRTGKNAKVLSIDKING